MSTTLVKQPPVTPHKVPAATSTLSPRQLAAALPGALRGLDPRRLWDSPVMFVVEVGAAFTTVLAILEPSAFAWSITVWLWLTVVFATLAESVAEGRGKAQAASLRATQRETTARKVVGSSTTEVPSSSLRVGDVVIVVAGETIPGDGLSLIHI